MNTTSYVEDFVCNNFNSIHDEFNNHTELNCNTKYMKMINHIYQSDSYFKNITESQEEAFQLIDKIFKPQIQHAFEIYQQKGGNFA